MVIEMRRKIYDKLIAWKNNDLRKPLIIFGARQVGKTYIIQEFCQQEYPNYFIVNLLNHPEIVELYQENISSDEKLMKLKVILGIKEENEQTILFVDEVQESEEFISNLKFINEMHPDLNIICAGSLLGVKLKRSHFSFPVGKVEMLDLYPMSFEEFLMAFNEDELIKEIKECYHKNSSMINILHQKALTYYELYLCTGGLPEAVQDLVNKNGDLSLFNQDIIKNIRLSYFDDMNKYVENKNESLKIEALYNSIPTQLGNLSNKFQANKVLKNGRMSDYDISIDWLLASRLINVTNCVNNIDIPLKAFVNVDTFKFYLNDVGLLIESLNLPFSTIINKTPFVYKGIITENYVASELINNGFDLFYWKGNRNSKIDFVLQTKDGIIPVEVKSAENTQAKSLKIYIEKYKPKYAIKICSKNFGYVKGIKTIPLYAVFCLNENS